jgi:soluble lytic murein transglycosylase-like protein
MAYQDAINAGIPPDKFVTQIQMESGFNPQAESPMGAEGIAQIMKATADSWGVNPWDPVASLNVAAQHMAWYQNTYGGFDKALAAYNGGVGRLVWAENNCSYWLNCEWPETIHYVHVIMGE